MTRKLLSETVSLTLKAGASTTKIAETSTGSKFHCHILRSACPIWIGESFKLCGFGGFFNNCPPIDSQSWANFSQIPSFSDKMTEISRLAIAPSFEFKFVWRMA